MKRKKRNYALKKAEHNCFVSPTMRLFHLQIETNVIAEEKMVSNSRLFLSLLNSAERKWSTGGKHEFVKRSQLFEI